MNNLKKIYCIYCNTEIYVQKFSANKQACKECLILGYNNPDGRTKTQANEKRKKTLQEKYGVDNCRKINGTTEKINKTCFEKYGGVGFASQELANKSNSTIKKIYNVENWKQTNEGKKLSAKIAKSEIRNKNLSISLRGKISPLKGKPKNKNSIKKTKDALLKKGYESIQEKMLKLNIKLISPEYLGSNIKLNYQCTKCGYIFKNKSWTQLSRIDSPQKCPNCYPRNSIKSLAEFEIIDFIKKLDNNLEIIQNDRSQIYPKELDIFIPEKNIAIEYNGLYFHSNLFHRNTKFDKNYHLKKLLLCQQKNIKLIQISDYQWAYSNKVVKNILKIFLKYTDNFKTYNKDRIKIHEVHAEKISCFLNENALATTNNISESDIGIGAFENKDLICLLIFNKFDDYKKIWKLKNIIFKIGYIIDTELINIIINFFKNTNQYNLIFVMSNREMHFDNLYENLNFEFIGYTAPTYFYINNYSNKSDKKGKFYNSGYAVYAYLKNKYLSEDLLNNIDYNNIPFTHFTNQHILIHECKICGEPTEHLYNISPNRVMCDKCRQQGKKIKETKILECFYCKNKFEAHLRCSNNFSVCPSCKSKGLKNQFASKNGKLARKRKR